VFCPSWNSAADCVGSSRPSEGRVKNKFELIFFFSLFKIQIKFAFLVIFEVYNPVAVSICLRLYDLLCCPVPGPTKQSLPSTSSLCLSYSGHFL
jgi:hypothetical protein